MYSCNNNDDEHFQLQEKRENSGAQSTKLRDLQQEASDKIRVCIKYLKFRKHFIRKNSTFTCIVSIECRHNTNCWFLPVGNKQRDSRFEIQSKNIYGRERLNDVRTSRLHEKESKIGIRHQRYTGSD